MSAVEVYLNGRTSEINQHVALLRLLERRSKEVSTKIDEDRIELRQVMIMKSSILVHLYNIVEAVMTRALNGLAEQVSCHHPKSYNAVFFREWMKVTARTHEALTAENLLDSVDRAGRFLIGDFDWAKFTISKGSGNWDDKRILKIAKNLGVPMPIEDAVSRPASEDFVDEDSRMVYLRKKRNELAHGISTFEDGARDRTIEELAYLSESVLGFLQKVAVLFEKFGDQELFLEKENNLA